MKIPRVFARRFAAGSLLALFVFAAAALAGPTLICHQFDIGNAKSLPWVSHDWNLTGSENYDTQKLANDTIAILDSDPTVLVHMETLRRATLFGRKDTRAARELLTKLVARADSLGSTKGASALAAFDAGYLAEAYKQWFRDEENPAKGLDGYALVNKAIQLRGNDAQMEFAAALIGLTGPTGGRPGQMDHAQKALVGAKSDSLLARNLSARWGGPQSQTMSDMINRTKMAQE